MTIDIARRQAVMERSQKLGHCICNPRHPCPCPPLIEHNVCPCAGERLPVKTDEVALTRHVRKAGCASKIGQADLLQILAGLPQPADPRVLVGAAAGDDAGVFQLNEQYALVQTVDVFTPVVDDAYLFGQIAAANSVSDCYAMGGTPLTALSIVGFPIEDLDGRIMEEMLRGGIEKLEEAGCSVVGGHSINDEEIKCGFAVTGIIDLDKPVRRDSAQPGDVLVLTKPLGTGMVAFAAQLGLVSEACLEEVGACMATLNKDAAELMLKYDAHACTDITGFGLGGHLVAMVRGSRVTARIDLARLPVFAAAAECMKHDLFSGAVDRNQAYAMTWVQSADTADPRAMSILYDPQTSGGLMVALPPEKAEAYVREMHARGHGATTVIGEITGPANGTMNGRVIVAGDRLDNLIGTAETIEMRKKTQVAGNTEITAPTRDDFACCDCPPTFDGEPAAPAADPGGDNGNADATLGMFREFMKEANRPGRIDQRNKKLMAIILSIAHHCEPCLRIHLQGALKMGIPREDIDEAANLAIAFGGCTAMMFYKEVLDTLNH